MDRMYSWGMLMAIAFAVLFMACSDTRREEVRIDFTSDVVANVQSDSTPPGAALRVVVASLISPRETFSSYQDLMVYLSRGMGLPTEFKQRKTYHETNQLLEQGLVDVAFLCSSAYTKVHAAGKAELLAVPLSHGRPYYRAYIITHEQSGIDSFEDFRGRSFAFTDPLSHTGYAYVVKKLMDIGNTAQDYFSTSFFTHAHDNSILLVEKQLVDGATIDGLIYDYFERFDADRIRHIRILERSEEFGIPPVVVPANTPVDVKQRLRDILFTMHENEEGRAILDHLLIDRFVEGRDSDYDEIRKIQRQISK
jgi:phosphonate transport system substrate-binding protein